MLHGCDIGDGSPTGKFQAIQKVLTNTQMVAARSVCSLVLVNFLKSQLRVFQCPHPLYDSMISLPHPLYDFNAPIPVKTSEPEREYVCAREPRVAESARPR
jgi:hypothetical protein